MVWLGARFVSGTGNYSRVGFLEENFHGDKMDVAGAQDGCRETFCAQVEDDAAGEEARRPEPEGGFGVRLRLCIVKRMCNGHFVVLVRLWLGVRMLCECEGSDVCG